MALTTITFDTDTLLELDPARAYAIASLAAAQNDAPVVEAFLRSGLNPCSTEHKNTQRRTRATMIHCPWLTAIRNDASDVVAAIARFKGPLTTPSRLMSIKPQGLNALQTALDEGAHKTLALLRELKLPVKPLEANSGGQGRPGEGAPLLWAAHEGLEDVARWLRGAVKGQMTAAQRADLLFHLAAGDCAALLAEEPLSAESILAARSLEIPVSPSTAYRSLSDIFRAFLADAREQGRPVGFDPLDWALWARAPRALRLFSDILGENSVCARAELWLRLVRQHGDGAARGVHGGPFALDDPRHPRQRLPAFMAHCEAVAIGAALLAAAPAAADPAPTPARPRGLRL